VADGTVSDDGTADPGLIAEKILSFGGTGGKTAVQAGILSVEKMDVDGGKAKLTLTADIDALRAFAAAADSSGRGWSGETRNCTFAVYAPEAFEELEKAVGDTGAEALREMGTEAVCSCRFTLRLEKNEKPAEDREPAVPAQTEEDESEEPAEEPGKSAEEQDQSSAAQISESPASAVVRSGEEEPAQDHAGDSGTSSDTDPVNNEEGPVSEEIQEPEDVSPAADPVSEPGPETVSGQGQESADREEEQSYSALEAGTSADRSASAGSAGTAASGTAEDARYP